MDAALDAHRRQPHVHPATPHFEIAESKRILRAPSPRLAAGPRPSLGSLGGYESVPTVEHTETDSPRRRGGTSYAAANRRRLHPLTLLPAVAFGALLALLWRASADIDDSTSWTTGAPRFGAKQTHYTLSTDGLLHWNWQATDEQTLRHPIQLLMQNATDSWKRMVARQSKTLGEAVVEYRRRYGRPPPRGFDDWYRFAMQNNVVLLDEYDSIDADISPFLALDPALLRERMSAYARQEHTHTLIIANGDISISSAGPDDAGLKRAREQMALMAPCKRWLHDTNITISPHDGPSVLMSDRQKTRHREAARRLSVLSDIEADETDDDPSLWGFPLACPSASGLHRAFNGLVSSTSKAGATFVYDHATVMDLCSSPDWQDLHGFTAWPGPRPMRLEPVFSFSKMAMHSDLRLVPLEQYNDTGEWDPPWHEKPFNRAVWRGSTTGVWFDRSTRWRSSQRVRLHWLKHDQQGSRAVRFLDHEASSGAAPVYEREVSNAALSQRYLDFAFVGEIYQCGVEDGSCEAARALLDMGDGLSWNEQNDYKYLLDVDGNAWSGRFHRLLASNSLVLKSTIFPEWYTGRIQPWLHYVPIKVDYSDLFDIMAFFSGDLEGRGGRDDLAQAIADAGKHWAEHHWRIADMQAYASRLYLEWARVTSFDREAAVYHL